MDPKDVEITPTDIAKVFLESMKPAFKNQTQIAGAKATNQNEVTRLSNQAWSKIETTFTKAIREIASLHKMTPEGP